MTIHPYTDGNGRVARAASQWLLLQQGYGPPAWTLGLDEFFAKDRARYYDMIRQTREMDGGYTHWVEYIAEGLLEAGQALVRRLKEGSRKAPVALTPKQEQLLDLLEARGVLGSNEIDRHMNINRARVNQLIGPLLKAKVVMKTGQTRSAKYSLA